MHVKLKNIANEEKIKADLIEETLRKVRKVMEERDLYDVELIHKILEHDLNRVWRCTGCGNNLNLDWVIFGHFYFSRKRTIELSLLIQKECYIKI